LLHRFLITRDELVARSALIISEVAADCMTAAHYVPLAALTNNWTRSLQLANIPPPQSATLGLYPVVCKLLLISHPTKDKRLSWPEHTVG